MAGASPRVAVVRFLLISLGTDGDVLPYLALGKILRERGHAVVVLANENFGPKAEANGLEFVSLVPNDHFEQVLNHPHFWHPLKSAPLLARWGAPLVPGQYELIVRQLRDQNDRLVASTGVLAARLVQERLGVPLVSVVLQPGLLQSVYQAPVLPIGPRLPDWLPRAAKALVWRLVDIITDRLMGAEVNRFRASLGLPAVHDWLHWWLSPHRVLALFPDWYGPPQPDWPAQLRQTGFPIWDGDQGPTLPIEVEDFITSAAPIVFTLGTGMRHGSAFFASAVAVCRRIGRRGLLLTRSTQHLPAELPDLVRHVPYAPFSALLPRAAAIVHHGGVGTTAQALRAGIPQLVMPLAFDQRDNAARIERLGVGAVLPPRQFKAQRGADKLRELLSSVAVARSCHEVKQRMARNPPLSRSCELLEELTV